MCFYISVEPMSILGKINRAHLKEEDIQFLNMVAFTYPP
jgi:hypothetical protein